MEWGDSVLISKLLRPYKWFSHPLFRILSSTFVLLFLLVLIRLSLLAKALIVASVSSTSLTSPTILSLLLFTRFSSAIVAFSLVLVLPPAIGSIRMLTKDAGGGDEGIEDARCDMSASSTKIERFSNDVLLGLDHRRVVMIEEVGSKEGHDVGINEGVCISKSYFDKRRISTMVSTTNFDSVTMEQ
ncbi:hypothetical protein B296_00009815 [Ensete ventricosum]|uniref:Uncharacterized protein n=1 Tax=Ensete ventricosum TaxID=4639 RepID=A0A427B5U0_ENSVE|nr:hypothetical protein B296_00009815 [Ensete ventricosum]